MYRNRARAAHVLQPTVPIAPGAASSSGPPPQPSPLQQSTQLSSAGQNQAPPPTPSYNTGQPYGSEMAAASVPFFNPSTYQNGHLEPPFAQQQVKGGDPTTYEAVEQMNSQSGSWNNSWQQPGLNNNIAGPLQTATQAAYQGQMEVGTDQNQKMAYSDGQTNQIMGNGDHLQQQGVPDNLGPGKSVDHQAHAAEVQQQMVSQPYQEEALSDQTPGGAENSSEYYPELILDPSGQWFWDYNQQQWFPYYPPQVTDANSSVVGNPTVAESTAIASDNSPDNFQKVADEVGELANSINDVQINQANPETSNDKIGERQYDGSVHSTPSVENHNLSYQNGPRPENHESSEAARPNLDPTVSIAPAQAGFSGQLSQDEIQRRSHVEVIPSSSKNGEPYLHASLVGSVQNHSTQGPTNHQSPLELSYQFAQDAPLHQEPGGMGPPDLVDHRPNMAQPEIVSDSSRLGHVGPGGLQGPSVPPPDMFASLPGSAVSPDITPGFEMKASISQPPGNEIAASEEFRRSAGFAENANFQHQTPDIGASYYSGQRVLQQSSPDLGMPSADVDVAGETGQIPPAPDLTAQSVISESGGQSFLAESRAVPLSVAHDQHYDFYKGQIESAMPDLTSNRSNVIPPVQAPSQEVQGKAPDILRTEPLVPTSDRNLFMETGELREEDAVRVSQTDNISPYNSIHSPIDPPIQTIGKPPSGLPPMVGGNEPPTLVRMVVGESLSSPQPPPLGTGVRLVEGESTQPPSLPPPLPAREVEGEAIQDPVTFTNTRTIEGEDFSSDTVPPPPVGTREVEGRLTTPAVSRLLPGATVSLGQQDFVSSTPSTPMESSPTHINSQTEARSEAAGSERRDETVMGGPPAMKAPPMPTPGRAVAGQESSTPYGSRRRGDNHKKSTYDSEDDRNPDSESEREREPRYPQPRRTISPSNRSMRSRPSRVYDRLNRDSTDRDEDSDRRNRDYFRDKRHDDRRRDYGRQERGQYRDSRRYRDEDDDTFRDDDRQSMRGGSRKKEDPGRYRDDYYRRHRGESDYERDSHYGGDDYLNRSRPGSRAGSVSHYDPNESMYRGGGGGMPSNMALFQQQILQHQLAMMNPLQYQIQTAVRDMEKVMENPSNVAIYKQHWDTYDKQPALMEKLRLENPVMHHLLHHFRQNYWHLVAAEEVKPAAVALVKAERMEPAQETEEELDHFARQFHQLSPSHRPESRQAGQESTIYGAEDSKWQLTSSSQLPERLTPLMFSRPHVCARISASGVLVKVDATSPQDGQTATVEMHSVSALMAHTRQHQQLVSFPGPLKPKETHKNDVIKFCERKMSEARDRRMMDRDSYELLWNMLILLLRQKGQVEGSDLADLLLREKRYDEDSDRTRTSSHRDDRKEDRLTSSASSVHSEDAAGETRVSASRSIINTSIAQEDSVAKFRSYLLHGNKQEGLEYAMKVGLWGHALFLASKMDQRTYAGVMTRFANGLAINDPLQTLYQLMSSRMPSAMKHCADQRWGDWRPHLAMILSNPLPGSDINRRSMVTLGDTLAGRGQLYAAQFCYIVSAVEFGTFSKKSSKLVLLCSAVGERSVDEFATNEAIQCTEIYEFVQRLGNNDFEMPTLQPFKFLHAVRLVECGLVTRAQDYCREIAEFVMKNPTRLETDFMPDFLLQLQHLVDKLKYQDPQYTTSAGELSEIPDPEWMTRFAETVQNMTFTTGPGSSDVTEQETVSYGNVYNEHGYTDQQQGYEQQFYQQTDQTTEATYGEHGFDNQGYTNSEQAFTNGDQGYEQTKYASSDMNYANADIRTGGEMNNFERKDSFGTGAFEHIPEPELQENSAPVQTFPSMFNPANYGESSLNNVNLPSSEQPTPPVVESNSRRSSVADNLSRKQSLVEPPPMGYPMPTQPMSLPPDPRPPSLTEGSNSKQSEPAAPGIAQPAPPQKQQKPEPAKKDGSVKGKKSSWLGGIFGKILKAPNQVHLPDDSDKKITFDEKLGRWVNEGEEEDTCAPAAPPPMDSSFMQPAPSISQTEPSMAPPNPPAQSFRAPKRRGRGYVDVFGQTGGTKPVTAPPPMLPGAELGPPSSQSPAMFNPTLGPISDEGAPSQEQEKVSAAAPSQPASMPMMFNPGSMVSVSGPPAF